MEAPSPFVEMGLFVSAEEEELGVARGSASDAEADEVRTGGRRIAAFVAAIKSLRGTACFSWQGDRS